MAVHPSGKLALTAGADRTLRLWDLTTGRTAFRTRLPQGACVSAPSFQQRRSCLPGAPDRELP
jgi:WD40 repeat protein